MSEKAPSISIITATYNAADHLPGLIESIRQQTDKDFDWIVIDGSSQDRTVDIINSAHDVITDYISEPDHGIYDALNKGIKRCKTDYYLVVGADDRLSPTAIENYKEAIFKTKADIITATVRVNNKLIHSKMRTAWLDGAWYFCSSHSVGTVIRRDLHEIYGYYSCQYPIAADADFILKLVTGGVKIAEENFIAGSYATQGISNKRRLSLACEIFIIQNEYYHQMKYLNLLILIARILRSI